MPCISRMPEFANRVHMMAHMQSPEGNGKLKVTVGHGFRCEGKIRKPGSPVSLTSGVVQRPLRGMPCVLEHRADKLSLLSLSPAALTAQKSRLCRAEICSALGFCQFFLVTPSRWFRTDSSPLAALSVAGWCYHFFQVFPSSKKIAWCL